MLLWCFKDDCQCGRSVWALTSRCLNSFVICEWVTRHSYQVSTCDPPIVRQEAFWIVSDVLLVKMVIHFVSLVIWINIWSDDILWISIFHWMQLTNRRWIPLLGQLMQLQFVFVLSFVQKTVWHLIHLRCTVINREWKSPMRESTSTILTLVWRLLLQTATQQVESCRHQKTRPTFSGVASAPCRIVALTGRPVAALAPCYGTISSDWVSRETERVRRFYEGRC